MDDEALELIRQQIRLDIERQAELKRQNDLAEAALSQAAQAETNRQIGERNRMAILVNISEQVAGLILENKKVILGQLGQEELIREMKAQIDRQDELFLILMTGRGNGNRARSEELTAELKTERTQRLLSQEYENLQELEEQAAQYGAGNAPLKTMNQIRATKRRIVELEEKLKGE